MKYLHEYRDPAAVRGYVDAIARTVTRPWTLMELCGGQTHSLVRFGIDELLPSELTLVHGPGCPVCVTPVETIDRALEIARVPNVTLCSFGDMLRVPGSHGDLFSVKAEGADIRVVYSPMDAVGLAHQFPDREVVFFAIGFETTAPANAMAAYQAYHQGLENFSMLVCHVLVPPAMESILQSPDNRVHGFLAAGHVCTIMGEEEYVPIATHYQVPIVVTGFEPVDLLQGIYRCVRQLEEGRHEVENAYSRSVRAEGNQTARRWMEEVFELVPRKWRGLGPIARSGLALKAQYAALDAEAKFNLKELTVDENPECHAGLVLRGVERPNECPAFGKRCTPDHPLGAPMVSSEGACAAYYRHGRFRPEGIRSP